MHDLVAEELAKLIKESIVESKVKNVDPEDLAKIVGEELGHICLDVLEILGISENEALVSAVFADTIEQHDFLANTFSDDDDIPTDVDDASMDLDADIEELLGHND